MFTLKLYRREDTEKHGKVVTKIIAVHRVVSSDMPGEKCVWLQAYGSDQNPYFDAYFIGDPSATIMDDPSCVIEKHGTENNSLWGWGILENWEGNTTEHFRPASYG